MIKIPSRALSVRILQPGLDERGSTLSVVLMFPFVLILILFILQIWANSTARTSAQIAADEALRKAQEYSGTDNDGRLTAGVNGALEQLQGRVNYIDTNIDSSTAELCKQLDEDSQARALSIVPLNTNCDTAPSEDTGLPEDYIVGIRIIDDELIDTRISVEVVGLFGTFSLSREVTTYACGLLDPVIWAVKRSETAIPDDYCINR